MIDSTGSDPRPSPQTNAQPKRLSDQVHPKHHYNQDHNPSQKEKAHQQMITAPARGAHLPQTMKRTLKNEIALAAKIIGGCFGTFLVIGAAVAISNPASTDAVVATESKFQVTHRSLSNLAVTCAKTQIKPLLRDPDSYRKLDHSHTMTDTHITVWVEYTAINGFGGRNRNTKQCTYTL